MSGKPETADATCGLLNMPTNLFHQIFEFMKLTELKANMLEDSLSRSRQAPTAITDDELRHPIEGFEVEQKQRPTRLIKAWIEFNEQRKPCHRVHGAERKMPTLINPQPCLIKADFPAPTGNGTENYPSQLVSAHIIYPVMDARFTSATQQGQHLLRHMTHIQHQHQQFLLNRGT